MLDAAIRIVLAALPVVTWFACAAPARAEDLPDFDKLWNFGDPAATEAKFREILPKAEASGNADYLAQLWTQIARTNSLRAKFDEAHAILDQVEKTLKPEMKTARVRFLLERGRTFNSSKKVDLARPLFLAAWDLAREARLDGLACDAGHMMGIVEKGDLAIDWDLKTLAYAEKSDQPAARRWLGTLYNNMGWTLHEKGQHAKALELFQKDLAFRIEGKNAPAARMAKWSVGRALRSLGRIDEALSTQRELEKEWQGAGEEDGYVFEEIAECLTAQAKAADAMPYFAKAHALLKDKAESEGIEAPRLERMRTLGGVDSK